MGNTKIAETKAFRYNGDLYETEGQAKEAMKMNEIFSAFKAKVANAPDQFIFSVFQLVQKPVQRKQFKSWLDEIERIDKGSNLILETK